MTYRHLKNYDFLLQNKNYWEYFGPLEGNFAHKMLKQELKQETNALKDTYFQGGHPKLSPIFLEVYTCKYYLLLKDFGHSNFSLV